MAAAGAEQGGVTDAMLRAVGREKGPDYMLKILPATLTTNFQAGVISQDSSITEVLNIVSYLCSDQRDNSLVDTNNSVTNDNGGGGSAIGAHTVTGLYAAGSAPINNTFIQSAAANMLFNITTLVPGADIPGAVIPVGILRRTENGAGASVSSNVKTTAPSVKNEAEVIPIMSDCVKQMINILTKTREIFGPKGWTALFNQVKGGGAGSKHAKRTHRQHRRRYSSKQY